MVKLFYNLAFVVLIVCCHGQDQQQQQQEKQAPVIDPPKRIKIYQETKVEPLDNVPADAKIALAKPVESENEQLMDKKGLLNLLNFNPFEKLFQFPSSDQSADQTQDQPTYRHRLFIFRISPGFGGDKDPDNVKTEQKLLGGGGENDPDFIRFQKDEPIGQDDQMMSHMMAHRTSMHSLMEYFRNMFNFMESQQQSDEDDDSTRHLPFVIRTEDGSEQIVPNDLAHENRLKENKNCMMLSFMRLKASIYYRTVLHLLFFTGILLFILSMIMITFRTFRKRRYSTLRYMPHNMDVSSIDGDLIKDKSRFESTKWFDIKSDRSTVIHGPESTVVLIQAPPAYDQVIVGDSSRLIDDKADAKSLPPGYDLINEKN